jgi:hypothetical protein
MSYSGFGHRFHDLEVGFVFNIYLEFIINLRAPLQKYVEKHDQFNVTISYFMCSIYVLAHYLHCLLKYVGVHSWLRYYFWDKEIKNYVALDLGVNHDLL